jgi:hypothetical protein
MLIYHFIYIYIAHLIKTMEVLELKKEQLRAQHC